MSRRGRTGPTISLFSFQDIITSVTAIVTVIALLLALDLVQRKQSQSIDSSASLAAELGQRLERTEAELAALRNETSSTDDLVRELAATSPAQLRNEIVERTSAIVELEREKSRLEEQSRVWNEKEKDKLAEQFDLQPLKDELVQVERTTSRLEQERSEIASDDRPIFFLPRGFQKEGWLVELDSDQISIAPLGRTAVPISFTPTSRTLFGSSAANALDIWIEAQNMKSAYFLILIRPDATALFHDVQEMLDRKSVSYGFDLLNAEQAVLHPERGAAY